MVKYKILFVDDVEFYANLLEKITMNWSDQAQLIYANSVAKAMDVLETQKIDLIISDYYMPEVTGLDFLKELKSHESYKSIPFVTISGDDNKALALETLKSGGDYFISKPFEESEYHQILDRLLVHD